MTIETTQWIEAVKSFHRLSPLDLMQTATAVYTGMKDNPAFSNSPVDMGVFKGYIDAFSPAITAADDGSKKAITERNRLAGILVRELRQLAKYVELISKDDMKTFLSSGFNPKATGRAVPSSLSEAIRSVKPGPASGQFLVTLAAVPGAHSYEIRCGALGAGGTPPVSWTNQPAGKTRPPTLITGLTPGTSYAIQVRAVTRSGYSDWSDSITRICV